MITLMVTKKSIWQNPTTISVCKQIGLRRAVPQLDKRLHQNPPVNIICNGEKD